MIIRPYDVLNAVMENDRRYHAGRLGPLALAFAALRPEFSRRCGGRLLYSAIGGPTGRSRLDRCCGSHRELLLFLPCNAPRAGLFAGPVAAGEL